MGEVVHNASYLNSGLDSIKTANDSGLNNLNLINASYNSTTKIPSAEPKLIEQLLKMANDLYSKLDKDLADIRSVGEGFATMDNFLEGQSIDLGFQVESNSVPIAGLSSHAAASLEPLLEKEVPIIEGYNDKYGKKPKEDNDSGYNERYYGPANAPAAPYGEPTSETPPETQTEKQTEAETEVKTEVKTETDTETKTEIETEVKTEVSSEVQTEVNTEAKTSAPVEVKTEAPKSVNKKKKNKGGTSKKPKKNVEEKPAINESVDNKTQESNTNEPVTNEPDVIEEPYVEPETIPEIVIDEKPSVIDLDQNVVSEEPKPKNNTGKVVAGVITGLGLATGAAVGYGAYKKSKEDKEYEDYGYEDGGDN